MIHCELCGGPLMVRPGGKEARCQNCGLLYPVEELKAMLAAAEGRPAKEPGEHYQGEPEAVWPEDPAAIRQEQHPAEPEQTSEARPRTEEEEASLAYFNYLFHGAFSRPSDPAGCSGCGAGRGKLVCARRFSVFQKRQKSPGGLHLRSAQMEE